MKKWAKYIVRVKFSVWGRILYASSLQTAEAMAKHYKGIIEAVRP